MKSPSNRRFRHRERSGLALQRLLGRASLIVSLGVSGLAWSVGGAIAPDTAHAQATQLAASLQRQPQESYDRFIQRAEATAAQALNQYFSQNAQAASALVTVTGASQGLQAPVLSIEVARAEWQSRPTPEVWATYFPSTRILLGFVEPPAEPVDDVAVDDDPEAVADEPDIVTDDGFETVPQLGDEDVSTGATVDDGVDDDGIGVGDGTGVDAIDEDVDVIDEDIIESETDTITPESNVTPLDNDNITEDDDTFDTEDTNDFEFLPNEVDDDDDVDTLNSNPVTEPDSELSPFNADPIDPIDPINDIDTNVGDDVDVIEESD